LATINATENNPLLAVLFGDHDGRVDAAVDVQRFQNLLLNEAKLIPLTTITGALNVTLDGKPPSSEQLQGIYFNNAPGLDSSSAPIYVSATVVAPFVWSGVGVAHTFEVAWNLPSILGNLTVGAGFQAVNISFHAPSGVTITSVTGLNSTQISNDPFGWGPAEVMGEYSPLPGHIVVIHFGPAFPTGYALIFGAVAVLAGLGLGLLLLRRRRRRRNRPLPPAVSDSGVGPSSGSG
ncbi:MAG: hypothetical protein L3K15_09660, partial [Thermoplasmata archaeon]|nr:hypothetical protein [Thermoplasmata archaeon]